MKTFDELLTMSPAELDSYRQEQVEEFIQTLPEDRQQRARQFQWRIDQELTRFRDPTQRFNHMVAMFWGGVTRLQSALSGAPRTKATVHQLGEPDDRRTES